MIAHSLIGLNDELPGEVTPLMLISFVVTLVLGYFMVLIVCKFLKKGLLKAKTGEILAEFLTRVIRILLLVFVFTTAIAFLGMDLGPALISFSVVLGFVLGFALGDTLSNIAAGFMIAINKPFEIGDFVTVSGETGVVKVVGISTTELDTPDNKHIIIPNKSAWGANITNFTHNPIRRVDMETGVSYDTDLNLAIKTTMDVLKGCELIIDDPEPQVEVKAMADSSVNLVVRPWCRTEDYWTVFFYCQKAIKEAYDAAGIPIPFPQMDVHLDKDAGPAPPKQD